MDDFISYMRCPHCKNRVMITIDTVSEQAVAYHEPERLPVATPAASAARQFVPMNLHLSTKGQELQLGPGHRFQACAGCHHHTKQTLTEIRQGVGRWRCDKCGKMAKARWLILSDGSQGERFKK
jgi:phage FluMu protein Com